MGMESAQIEQAEVLASTARMAAIMGAGQTPLIQGILRQGLVGPLEDRFDGESKAAAVLLEPLVEEQAAEILGLLLQQEGDRRVIRGDEAGVRLLFQSVNSGYGWIRLFRVEAEEGAAYRGKITACLNRLAERLEATPSSMLYGLFGLPIGMRLSKEAIREHLLGTRWADGHWMAAAYVPEKAGFAPLGIGHTALQRALDGRAVAPRGTQLASALDADPDLDILPSRGREDGLGALWGGEAMVDAVSKALQGGFRLDIQWTPVPYEAVSRPLDGRHASPFWGAEIGDLTEVSPLGVLVPTPSQRILVAFEAPEEGVDGVGVGALDPVAEEYLVERYKAVRTPNGKLVLPKASVWGMLSLGMPIWNRLLRLSQTLS